MWGAVVWVWAESTALAQGNQSKLAYLHAIHRLIVINKLKKPLWIRHKTATLTMHAILAKSNHNHDRHLTQQHVPRKIMEKLPEVVLT
jgi:hypothetical protein